MKIKFLGQYGGGVDIPCHEEFSIPIEELRYRSLLNIVYNGKYYSLHVADFVAVAAETVEDSLFLDSLKQDVISHKQIILCNCDTRVYVPGCGCGRVGRYLLDGERFPDWTGNPLWHYLVSEMVKEAGILYWEISSVFNEQDEFISFRLFKFENKRKIAYAESRSLPKLFSKMRTRLGISI